MNNPLSAGSTAILTLHAMVKLGLVAAAAFVTFSAASSPASGQTTASTGWKQYHDTNYNFDLSIPAGWTVQVDARKVVVARGDRTAFAVIENFAPQGDETAEDHVDDLPKTDAALLPGCKISEAYTLDAPVKKAGSNGAATEVGEQAVGVMTYNTERGPGQARILCLVFPKGGLLFGLAASNDRFGTDRPDMVRILQSFRIAAASNKLPARGKKGLASGAGAAAPTAPTLLVTPTVDPVSNFKFVPFSDPKEQAFTVEIPQGWSQDGGTYRASIMDSRQTILVSSPHNDMSVMLGDSAIPRFVLPSRANEFIHHPEGTMFKAFDGVQSMVLRYMPAADFNHWYLNNFMRRSVDDLVIGQDTEQADVAHNLFEGLNKELPPGSRSPYTVTMSRTAFTCHSKRGGRQMAGILVTVSTRFIGNAQGDGNWSAKPNLYVWTAGDDRAAARQAGALAVYNHMMQTFKIQPSWLASDRARQTAYFNGTSRANTDFLSAQAAAAKDAELSRRTAQASDDRRQKMTDDFNASLAARDDNTRKVVNYALDQKDVTDGTTSWKVSSAYTYYYRNPTTSAGYGTNDTGYPDVGFTQLRDR